MPDFPTPPPDPDPTPRPALEQAVQELAAAAPRWVACAPERRASLLRECIATTAAAGEEWVALSCRAKGLRPGSAGEGEEWLSGVEPVLRNLRLLAEAMDAGGAPAPAGTYQRPDGQWVAKVFPRTLLDRPLINGCTMELWIEPGERPTQGRIYRDKAAGEPGAGGVCAVLGAGNQSSIGPMDVLYKLFADDEVCALKMNPVNEYLGPVLERALSPLVREGFLRIVYGGADAGDFLCTHESVTSIHMTGSTRVHDLIVWGEGEEQQRNKEAGTPRNGKEMSSELGCITPVLVVPGPWSESDLAYHARNVAAMVTYNAGFNCNGAKTLLLASGWAQKDRFVELLERALARHPARKAYYPGSDRLWDELVGQYPQAKALGERSAQVLPWTLVRDVPARPGETLLNREPWCGLMSVVEIEAEDAPSFLEAAVPFANESVWGSLTCMVLVHPRTERAHRGEVDAAIAGLRYGGVAINCWSGVLYALAEATWGAFPGNPLEDVGSGRGVVHNALLFDHPQKTVARVPFRLFPTPPWFTDHRNLAEVGRRFAHFEQAPGLRRLLPLGLAALRG